MASFLIAGVSGYVGSRLALRLINRGHRVRGITRYPAGEAAELLAAAGVVIWHGDLTRAETLVGVTDHIDYVYNLSSASPLNDGLLAKTLVEGNRNLIAACSRSRSVRGYLFTSHAAVYGDGGSALLFEDAPIVPTSPLGVRYAEAEQVIMSAIQQHRFPATILRVGNVYGRHRDLIEQIEAGTAVIYGEGRNFVPQIHVRDLVELLADAPSAAQLGAIYNVADPNPLTQLELHRQIRNHLGMVPPRTFSSQIALQSGIHPTIIAQARASLRLSTQRLHEDFAPTFSYPSYLHWIGERLGAAVEFELAASA